MKSLSETGPKKDATGGASGVTPEERRTAPINWRQLDPGGSAVAEGLRTDPAHKGAGGDRGRTGESQRTPAAPQAERLVEEARARARSLIEEAREEAQGLRREAEEQVDGVRQQAHDEGYAVGEQKGLEVGLRRVRETAEGLLREAREIVALARREREEMLARERDALAALVTKVARKVVHQELRISPSAVVSMAEEALEQLREADDVKVLAGLEDVKLLKRSRQRLLDAAVGARNLEIEADESLHSGDVVVETEQGRVDARLETKFATLEEAVMGEEGT